MADRPEGHAVLSALRTAGLVTEFDVRFADALCRIAGDESPQARLAVAMANRQASAGHTCFTLGDDPRLSIDGADLSVRWPSDENWKALETSRLLNSHADDSPLVRDEQGRVFLRRYWSLEQSVASRLAAREPCTLIFGGPGTGKTFTAAGTLALFVQDALARGLSAPRVLVLAPTGKAAARLSEALQRNTRELSCPENVRAAIPNAAETIHRALGARKRGRGFAYGAERPLSVDMVVIDEASMIDLSLMDALLKAIPDTAKLVMLGDPDQLSSVEAGSVFADLCDFAESSGAIPAARLTTVHRYGASSGIAMLAEAVRTQNADEALRLLNDPKLDDARLIPTSELSSLEHKCARSLQSALSSDAIEAQLQGLKAHQVLCARRTGPSGVQRFNSATARYLARVRAPAPEVVPIIIERNDHDLGLYNGDVGLLQRGAGMAFFIDSEGEPRQVPQVLLPQHDLAFAISIHKSQGSEFGEVSVVLPDEDSPLMTRELLYTAVTRARKVVRIVSTEVSLRRAIARHGRRQSGLKDALRKQLVL